jgi:hypothetical protein
MNLAKSVLLLSLIHIFSLAHAAYVEVPLSQMEVTEGANGVTALGSGIIDVTGPRFRATEIGHYSIAAQLMFVYGGEAENGVPLEGGDYRIQIGQKLLSANPCNLIYVMWRLYPQEQLVVSIKRYPADTSAVCGNKGYTNIVPNLYPQGARSAAIPISAANSARTGIRRTLTSDFNGRNRMFTVRIGDDIVWRGNLPRALVRGLAGPAGIRTDNGKFRLRFYTRK